MLESILSQAGMLAQITFIDITLAGDNILIIGMAATGLASYERSIAITLGIVLATLFRIILAFIAVHLLRIPGFPLLGGVLLLWVCWYMFATLREQNWNPPSRCAAIPTSSAIGNIEKNKQMIATPAHNNSLWRAIRVIIIADLSMSLDNILAVAAVAKNHLWVLVAGLSMSVFFMAFAASLVTSLLNRYRWLGWVGLLVILGVALRLILHGLAEITPMLSPYFRIIPMLDFLAHHDGMNS